MLTKNYLLATTSHPELSGVPGVAPTFSLSRTYVGPSIDQLRASDALRRSNRLIPLAPNTPFGDYIDPDLPIIAHPEHQPKIIKKSAGPGW
jgi:hypothetical protein